jgi:pimeloyl-ACP methyl ester carboxylesterase
MTTAACALLILSGCNLIQVRRANEKLAALAEVEGVVKLPAGATEGDKPIIVLLLREDAPTERVQSSVVLYKPGLFHFFGDEGKYKLFAFVDENSNLSFDEGELAGYYGGATATELELFETRPTNGLEIALAPGIHPAVPYYPKHDQVVTLDDERVSKIRAAKGMWSASDFLDDYGEDKLYLMEPFDPNKLPVVFVHGIGGTPSDMTALIEKVDRTRFQPWLFWYGSGKRLDACAQSLRQVLDEFRVLHEFSNIVIVAQSVGGLVARDAVAMLQDRDHKFNVAGLLTLSTPWGGHSKADLGVRISLLVLPAWFDIVPESTFQQRLLSTPVPGVRHYLFFSYGTANDHEGNDGSVALSSELNLTMQRNAVEVLGFPETHMGIITNPDAVTRFGEVLSTVRDQVASTPPVAPGSAR